MTLRREFSLGHSEFNEFLFASVGEEKNGTELTVLSALTRLGLDPWGEAARLSDLPREAAARALAAVIALLPEGDWTKTDSGAIARRLVSRLPQSQPAVSAPQAEPTGKAKPNGRVPLSWVAALLGLLLLVVLAIGQADHPPESGPTAVPPSAQTRAR